MAPLTPEESSRAVQRLSAGRIVAMDKQPYLSKSLLAMLPIERENFGTFAVDKRWRMYYDPAVCLKWSIDEIAAAWLHECSHLVRIHAQRFETIEGQDARYAKQWNQAADAAINSDLKEIDVLLADPDKRFYAQSNPLYPDWAPGMTTEQMFVIAKKGAGGDEKENDAAPGGSDEAESDSSPSESNESDSEGESGLPEKESSSDPDDGDAEEDGSGEGSEESPETDGTDESDSKDGDPSDGNESGEDEDGTPSEGKGEPTSESDSSAEEEKSPGSDCGSGASGGPSRDYEEKDLNDGSLDPFDAEQIREETARDIMDAARAGTVPAGLVRSADEILNPKVDWQSQLSRWMRRTTAQIIGQTDYSFSRRSRASLMTQFYLPGLRDREPPVIKIVLDTSGSMQPDDLARGLSEICAILEQTQRNANTPVELINCDAGVHTVAAIRNIDQIEIRGGGGTDMRIGMVAAAQARPAADIVLIITDGGTPWMPEPPRENIRAKYVVLLVEQKNTQNLQHVIDLIPRWMEVIPTYR